MFIFGGSFMLFSTAQFLFSGVLTQILCAAIKDLENGDFKLSPTCNASPQYEHPSYPEIVRYENI